MKILAQAVGRRKEAVAQIQIIKGTGQFIINNKSAQNYLQNNSCSLIAVKSPFILCELISNSNQIGSSFKLPGSTVYAQEKEKNISSLSSQGNSGVGVGNLPNTNTPNLKNAFDLEKEKATHIKENQIKSITEGDNQSFALKTQGDEPTATMIHNLVDSNTLKFSFEKIDTIVKVKGGGLIGQTEAIKLGVARALCSIKDLNSIQFTSSDSSAKEKLDSNSSLEIEEKKKQDLPGDSTDSNVVIQNQSITDRIGAAKESIEVPNPKNVFDSEKEKTWGGTHIKDLNLTKGNLSEITENLSKTDNLFITYPPGGAKKEGDKELPLETVENLDIENLFKKQLKTKGYLTQDSRVKERRKYGLKKARKASQYHKR